MDTILKASTTIHKCIFTSKLILETLIWRSKLKMAKFIKTKNMPSLPVITFATETNTHKKKLWESKQVYHLDDWGRKRDDQLPHHQAHTYIHYITYYVFTMYYVLFLYQVFTLGYIYLSINQICTTEMMMPCVGFFGKDTLVDII